MLLEASNKTEGTQADTEIDPLVCGFVSALQFAFEKVDDLRNTRAFLNTFSEIKYIYILFI